MKKEIEELVMWFLELKCPIIKTRVSKKKRFTKSLVVMSGIINSRELRIPYDNPAQKDVMLGLIIEVIIIVFALKVNDATILAKKHLNY